MRKNRSIEVGDATDDVMHKKYLPEPNRWKRFFYFPFRIFFPSAIFGKLFLASIIPALADHIIPLFYVGQIPDESSLALAGQFTFISIVLEVIQEGIVNSLFHFVGKNYKENRQASLGGLKLCFILLVVSGSLLAAALLIFTGQFVSIMNTPSDIVEKTKSFLSMTSFSFPLILLNAAITNFLFITTSPLLVVAQIIQAVISFLLNFFLFGRGTWSLHWGLDELGIYKVLQNGVNLLVNFVFLHTVEKMSLKTFWWDTPLRSTLSSNFKALLAVSWGSFADSAVRNFFYFVVTLKFINEMGSTNAGAWNLLNTIAFGALLLPMNAVANMVKVLVGHAAESPGFKPILKEIANQAFLCLSAWTCLIAFLSSIFWGDLAAYFSKSNIYVQDLSAMMFSHMGWVFIIFSFNTVLDSLFYGTGKTEFVFYQSLITNLLIYLPPWILYEAGILLPSYWLVIGLYMGGMTLDFLLTLYFSVRLWQNIPE